MGRGLGQRSAGTKSGCWRSGMLDVWDVSGIIKLCVLPGRSEAGRRRLPGHASETAPGERRWPAVTGQPLCRYPGPTV